MYNAIILWICNAIFSNVIKNKWGKREEERFENKKESKISKRVKMRMNETCSPVTWYMSRYGMNEITFRVLSRISNELCISLRVKEQTQCQLPRQYETFAHKYTKTSANLHLRFKLFHWCILCQMQLFQLCSWRIAAAPKIPSLLNYRYKKRFDMLLQPLFFNQVYASQTIAPDCFFLYKRSSKLSHEKYDQRRLHKFCSSKFIHSSQRYLFSSSLSSLNFRLNWVIFYVERNVSYSNGVIVPISYFWKEGIDFHHSLIKKQPSQIVAEKNLCSEFIGN